MIISKLQGGLGNQLFQWAAARSYAIKYNCEYKFDISFYPMQNFRKLLIPEFKNIKFDIFNNFKLNDPIYKIVDDFNYREIENKPNHTIFLDGFWQSEKYFKENESYIKSDLLPSNDLINKITTNYPINGDITSIHVRRTDYVSSNGYHPVQSINYYENALKIINKYDKIYIFSDDIEWCKSNLNFDNMVFIENQTNIEDLYLMSLCKNNIISNSSFSWWAAWLNKNPDKKIVAPINWFGNHVNINSSDIVPNNWIKL